MKDDTFYLMKNLDCKMDLFFQRNMEKREAYYQLENTEQIHLVK